MEDLKNIIEKAWGDRALLADKLTQNAIREVVAQLDNGSLRVASPIADGWQVNAWVKKAVVLDRKSVV